MIVYDITQVQEKNVVGLNVTFAGDLPSRGPMAPKLMDPKLDPHTPLM